MKRPAPSSEIVIRKQEHWGRLIITTHSRDAREWIESESVKFGQLFHWSLGKSWSVCAVYITTGYDLSEVAAWLESQGDDK
jgi:hypothetical protein